MIRRRGSKFGGNPSGIAGPPKHTHPRRTRYSPYDRQDRHATLQEEFPESRSLGEIPHATMDAPLPVSPQMAVTSDAELYSDMLKDIPEVWDLDDELEMDAVDPSIEELNLSGRRIRSRVDRGNNSDDDHNLQPEDHQDLTITATSRTQIVGTMTIGRNNHVILNGEEEENLHISVYEDSDHERLNNTEDVDNTQEEPATQGISSETLDENLIGGTEFTNYDPAEPNDIPVDDFHYALMVFFTACDLSHQQYAAFREVVTIATMESISSLPESLATLKRRVRRNMPLMKLRGDNVAVQLDKIPPKSVSPQTGYRFEIREYINLWLANTHLTSAMYFGMGVIPDGIDRKEFYHGDAWLSSVRTTSGEFAWLKDDDKPLFPSDCVSYISPNDPTPKFLRIHGVGYIGSSAKQRTIGVIAKRLLPVNRLPEPWVGQWDYLLSEHISRKTDFSTFNYAVSHLPELILMDDDRLVFRVADLQRRESVHFLDCGDVQALQSSLLPTSPTHCVRYIAYTHQKSQPRIRGIHQRHRLPAETELQHLGREHIIREFVGEGRISVPFTIFMDGFGLYRNAYHSLQGVYIQPANLDESARFTLQNMWVLMLGVFGGNDQDIASCLATENSLGAGGYQCKALFRRHEATQEVQFAAFPICITGDMPQQNHNAGIMSPAANANCRYCYSSTRADMRMDITLHRRYYQPHCQFVANIQNDNQTKTKRDVALAKYGINQDGEIFKITFPILDPFSCFPVDPMHCELRLAKYFHEVLVTDYLSKAGLSAYTTAWQMINVPYGW